MDDDNYYAQGRHRNAADEDDMDVTDGLSDVFRDGEYMDEEAAPTVEQHELQPREEEEANNTNGTEMNTSEKEQKEETDVIANDTGIATMDDEELEQESEIEIKVKIETKVKKDNVHALDPASRKAVFIRYLKQIFPTTQSEPLFNSILTNIERLWIQLHEDEFFLQEKTIRYTELYHLLAILDAMKTGFTPLSVSVIPLERMVRDYLPIIRRLQFMGVRVTTFTSAKRVLRESLIRMVKSHSYPTHLLTWITN
jgi:hypothetical protein